VNALSGHFKRDVRMSAFGGKEPTYTSTIWSYNFRAGRLLSWVAPPMICDVKSVKAVQLGDRSDARGRLKGRFGNFRCEAF
jgi:hypothetical protein